MTISPTRFAYPAGYNALIVASGLAEQAPVRGCMVIKPYGYALWEAIKDIFDQRLKRTGVMNASFPLLIPMSHLSRESSHVDGFAEECAIVTHYRVKRDANGDITPDPKAKLQEPLVVRPTSEAMIWDTYSKWVKSYRDLPLRFNQWANVVRWERRTRLFMRTLEFHWQEGHTAHATEAEAKKEAMDRLYDYVELCKMLALPVVIGQKTTHERFAGAHTTYTFEALMQDGKALQMGTSHFLAQIFAKAFHVRFADEKGNLKYPWGTSFGITTRTIGAIVMVHSDEKGLRLPPKVAPVQAVVIPVIQSSDHKVAKHAHVIAKKLQKAAIRVKVDDNPVRRLGWKLAEYELKGVPLSIVIGKRELEHGQVTLIRRDTQEKVIVALDVIVEQVKRLLGEIQHALYERAMAFLNNHTVYADDYASFKRLMKEKAGFIMAHWDGTTATEKKIHEETQATIRCIPLDTKDEKGTCIYSKSPSSKRVVFAQAY